MIEAARNELVRLVADVVTAMESADFAALTIGESSRPTVACSDRALLLEMHQRSTGDGPSPAAYRSAEVTRMSCGQSERWPEFRSLCEWHQIRSVLSVPVVDDDRTASAVLTIYSEDHHAFGANEIRLGRSYAALARQHLPSARPDERLAQWVPDDALPAARAASSSLL